LKSSTDFNKGMANVASLIPGNIKRVEELKGTLQDMADEFGKGTDDLSQGLYQIISAFGDTADTAKILETNVKAATAGVATTADAINLTSAVTKAYGDTSADAVQQVSDLALLTVRLGQTTFPELAASIGRVTPLTKALGVSQQELFAVMATATGVTGNAAEVSTQLRGVLQSLLAPTDAAKKAIKDAGYESAEAMLKQEGLAGSLEILVEAAEKSGKPLQDYIGSIEGQTLALALAGPQADEYKKKLGEMADAAGTTDEAFNEQARGINALGFAFDQLKQVGTTSLQKLGDAIGNAFGPEIIKGVQDLQGALDDVIAGIDSLLGGTSGNVEEAIMRRFGEPVQSGAQKLQDGIGKIVEMLANTISTALPIVISALAGIIISLAKSIPSLLPPLVRAFVDGIRSIGQALPEVLPALVQAIADALVVLATEFGKLAPVLIPVIVDALNQMIDTLANNEDALAEAAIQLTMGILVGIRKSLPEIIRGMWNLAVTLLSTFAKYLGIKSPSKKFAEMGRYLIEGLIQGLKSMMGALGAWLGGLWARVKSAVGNAATVLLDRGKSLISGILNGVKERYSALASWVAAIPGKLKDRIGDIGSRFLSIGREITAGIKRGLQNTWDGLVSKLKTLTNMLPAAVKKLLHIASPSKVFAWIGEMMTEGWGAGITRNAGSVVAAVRNTTQRIIDEAAGMTLSGALSLSPALSVPSGYQPSIGGGAFASSAASVVSNRDGDLTVVFQAEPVSYADTVRGVRDAQRAAARW
jgi:TP901 family phage tail tape measure protein